MGEVIYNKTCRFCNQEYQSTSRNQRYCSSECAEKAQKKRLAQKKKSKVRHERYEKNKDIERLLARSYAIAQELGLMIPKVCAHTVGSSKPCEGKLELHHRDKNPFNNSLSNLCWCCRNEHEHLDPRDEDRSIVEIIARCVESDNPQEEFIKLVYDEENAEHTTRARERREARELKNQGGQRDEQNPEQDSEEI